MNTKKNFCRDSMDTFDVDGVPQNCKWLELYWPRTADYCSTTEVALACPSTCGYCEEIKEQNYD
jgi:hypothetical protein